MTATVTFEDLAQMEKRILGRTAPASIVPDVDRATKFRRLLQSDLAIGRLLTGPQMIDTVAIDNGAITAEKLTASLVISTEIIAGAVSPADRLTLDATGIKAYGTVTGTPNTNTLTIGVNGDFTFGTGATAITYVASTGVLTVPAAAIGSLTIANVGSGNIGGTYATSTSNPKVELSPTQFRMTNGSGVNVFSLNATTGVFTMSDSPAGANRLDITSGSISLYKASTREFYLAASGASNPVEMLLTGGGAGQYVGMNAVDGIWTGASTFSGAATKFRVSPAGVLDATAANISGAITATSGSLSSLSIAGTLTMGASGLIRTSATTTRVEMDNTGLYGYNSGTLRFQVLNNGSGFLGASTTLSWTSAGALTLAGFSASSTTLSSGSGGSFVTMSSGSTAFSAGGATPSTAPFSVSSAGALRASSLVITGAATFSGGSLTLPNGGTITSTTVDINGGSSGPGTMENLTIDGDITIGAGGKLKFGASGADYLDNNILHFEVGSSETAMIEIMNGSGDRRAEFTGLGGATTGQVAMSAYSDSFPSTAQATIYANLSATNAVTSLLSIAGGITSYVSVDASGGGGIIGFSADSFDFNAMGYTAVALGAYVGKISVGTVAGSTAYLPLYR